MARSKPVADAPRSNWWGLKSVQVPASKVPGPLQPPGPDRQRRHQEPRHLLGLDAETGARQRRGLHPRGARQGCARLQHDRRAKNLSLGSLLEAVRDRTKTVDLKQVNPRTRGRQDGGRRNVTLRPICACSCWAVSGARRRAARVRPSGHLRSAEVSCQCSEGRAGGDWKIAECELFTVQQVGAASAISAVEGFHATTLDRECADETVRVDVVRAIAISAVLPDAIPTALAAFVVCLGLRTAVDTCEGRVERFTGWRRGCHAREEGIQLVDALRLLWVAALASPPVEALLERQGVGVPGARHGRDCADVVNDLRRALVSNSARSAIVTRHPGTTTRSSANAPGQAARA